MNLYFENAYGDERLLGTYDSFLDACGAINEFLDEHNYKCYYMRNWVENGRITVDVGSHSEFFHIARADGTPFETLEQI